jgi:deoxyadenosine/deoxycytidine kinase
MMSRRVLIFTISGLIGTGKSTLLAKAERADANKIPGYRVVYVYEPKQLWEQMGVLQAFYDNRHDNAFPFQLIVYDTHIEANENMMSKYPDENLIIISERGIFDQALFWRKQVEDGELRSAQAIHDSAYQRIWNRFNRFIPVPSGIIYLDATVDAAMERKKNREREKMKDSMPELISTSLPQIETPSDVSLRSYQDSLKAFHDEWFQEPVARMPMKGYENIPCLKIPITNEPYHIHDGSLAGIAKKLRIL